VFVYGQLFHRNLMSLGKARVEHLKGLTRIGSGLTNKY
jgi:hypothetical protein